MALVNGMNLPLDHCHTVAYYCRLDLYDLGSYFSQDVPIQALSSPLLKAAVCAYTAKYLGRVNVDPKAGSPSPPGSMTMSPEADQVDLAVLEARYYASAINLLRETLEDPRLLSFSSKQSSRDLNMPHDVNIKDYDDDQMEAMEPAAATSKVQISTTGLDEVLAATAILCAYEHISASNVAWSGHLSGTRMLLDMAKFGLMPSTMGSEHTNGIRSSKARRSIFWNFVRQDLLAACRSQLTLLSFTSAYKPCHSHRWQPDTYQYRRCTYLEGCRVTVRLRRKHCSQACIGR